MAIEAHSPEPAGWRANRALVVFTGDVGAMIGLVVFLGLCAACFLGPLFYSHDHNFADFTAIGAPFALFSSTPFGTDDMGRDLLLRTLVAGQVSLAIGVLGALVAATVSLIVGSVAGTFGGIVDLLVVRVVDILLSIPFMFVAIVLGVVLGGGAFAISVAITATLWLVPTQVTRATAAQVAKSGFIEAAEAVGMSRVAILFRHVMPNTAGVAAVYSCLLVSEAIIVESFLSFLGVGIQPPNTSWGRMIADGIAYLEADPRLVIVPSVFLSLALVSLALITEGLRRAAD